MTNQSAKILVTNSPVVISVFLIWVLANVAQPTEVLIDDFSTDRDKWYAASGDWHVHDQILQQTATGSYASGVRQSIIFRRIKMRSGRISVRARPKGKEGVWILPKYFNTEQRMFVQFGRNGSEIVGFVEGQGETLLGEKKIEPDKWNHLSVEVQAGRMTAYVNGQLIGSMPEELSASDGFVALGIGEGSFDDFRVEGDIQILPDASRIKDSPKPKVLFESWHPVRLQPQEAAAVHGSLYVYISNQGKGPAKLEDVTLAGQSADLGIVDDWLAYAVLSPPIVPPGETGELHIRVRGVPVALLDQFLETQQNEQLLKVPVTIRCTHADPVTHLASLWGPITSLQLNVITFSRDLRTVYTYVQNNSFQDANRPHHPNGRPLTISRVTLNGQDVTKTTQFGSREVTDGIVPLVISLNPPLQQGQHAVITVETSEGVKAGLSQRAFPGRFDVLVRGHSHQHRKDVWEDLTDHGVTHVSNMLDRNDSKIPPPSSGLRAFDMAPREPHMLASFLNRDRSGQDYDLTDWIWIDEVDKGNVQPIENMLRSLREVERYYLAEGRPHTRYLFNCVRPFRGSRYHGHLAYPDTVMHARGYLMCRIPLHPSFGRFESLPLMEYRISRRPHLPHHRDAEINIPYDPKQKICKPPHKFWQRIITPAEERWMYYGNLIQGMKSIAHWGYWAHFERSGFYSINEPTLRIGLGGLDENRAYDWEDRDSNGNPVTYFIPNHIVNMLRDTWDEIGRLNLEMQAVGESIAQSDVTGYAQVTKVEPPRGIFDLPAASTAALIHGLDTIVIPVVNHNLEIVQGPHSEFGPLSNSDVVPLRYDPVDVRVELTVPPWLCGRIKHVFRIDYQTIEPLQPQQIGNQMVFEHSQLAVSDLIVVTASDKVLQHARQTLAQHAPRIQSFEAKTRTLKKKLASSP